MRLFEDGNLEPDVWTRKSQWELLGSVDLKEEDAGTFSKECTKDPDVDDKESLRVLSRRPSKESLNHDHVHVQWVPGDQVERLLDDVSDIWVGAVVLRQSSGRDELYDVQYVDNGSIEHDVELQELRPRKVRLDLPVEVWTAVGVCLHEKQDLSTFEALGRAAAAAMKQKAQVWWCTAYHERFGRCCGRCTFERGQPSSWKANGEIVTSCLAAAAQGLTPMDRLPWKTRFAEQEMRWKRLHRVHWQSKADEEESGAAPGDVAYGASGKKVNYQNLDGRLRYGNKAQNGMYFDPRLGHMVRDT